MVVGLMINEKIVIYPTDTVWGIGSSMYSESAYLRIQKIKRSIENKPLSILFPDVDELLALLKPIEGKYNEWLERFFSLETTLLIPLEFFKENPPSWITQNSKFVGVRELMVWH